MNLGATDSSSSILSIILIILFFILISLVLHFINKRDKTKKDENSKDIDYNSKYNAGDELRDLSKKYRKAIKYLDECGEFTYNKLIKVNKIAGSPIPSDRIRIMWEGSATSFPLEVDGKYLSGPERLRNIIREKFQKAITEFEPLANNFDSIKLNKK